MISIALPPTRIAGAGGGVSWPTKQKKQKNRKENRNTDDNEDDCWPS